MCPAGGRCQGSASGRWCWVASLSSFCSPCLAAKVGLYVQEHMLSHRSSPSADVFPPPLTSSLAGNPWVSKLRPAPLFSLHRAGQARLLPWLASPALGKQMHQGSHRSSLPSAFPVCRRLQICLDWGLTRAAQEAHPPPGALRRGQVLTVAASRLQGPVLSTACELWVSSKKEIAQVVCCHWRWN